MRDFIKKILDSGADLIGFGEIEHGIHTKIFKDLSSSMDLFGGIFLEQPADYQTSVDFYFKFGKLDHRLKNLVAGALKLENKDVKDTLTTILNLAKISSLPTICIDSSKIQTNEYSKKSKFSNSFLRGNSRDEDMFFNVINQMEIITKKWLFIAHAAHLDTMLNINLNDASTGKRLREKMGNRFFNVCLLKIPQIAETKYFMINETIDSELKDLLEKNKYSFFIQNNQIKSFNAFIIHS